MTADGQACLAEMSAGPAHALVATDYDGTLAPIVDDPAAPAAALARRRDPLSRLADSAGLTLEPGRLVLELRPPGMDKGAALRQLAAERTARSVLYCGDDLGDLAAFAAIRRLRADGVP